MPSMLMEDVSTESIQFTDLDVRDVQASVADWIGLVRGEYLEMPGLSLTKQQVQKLWNLDPVTSDCLLDRLVKDGFLRRSAAGTYLRIA